MRPPPPGASARLTGAPTERREDEVKTIGLRRAPPVLWSLLLPARARDWPQTWLRARRFVSCRSLILSLAAGGFIAAFTSFAAGARPTTEPPECFFLECGPSNPIEATTPSMPARPHYPHEICARFEGGQLCATSVLAPDRDIAYGPENLFDDDLTTGWAEGAQGDGVGELLIVAFDEPTEFRGFRILNGYHKSEELWRSNARVARVRVTTPRGEIYEGPVGDAMRWQNMGFPKPQTLPWILIEILEVYPGEQYRDTMLTEFRIVYE